jgi:hypothetical protein
MVEVDWDVWEANCLVQHCPSSTLRPVIFFRSLTRDLFLVLRSAWPKDINVVSHPAALPSSSRGGWGDRNGFSGRGWWKSRYKSLGLDSKCTALRTTMMWDVDADASDVDVDVDVDGMWMLRDMRMLSTLPPGSEHGNRRVPVVNGEIVGNALNDIACLRMIRIDVVHVYADPSLRPRRGAKSSR